MTRQVPGKLGSSPDTSPAARPDVAAAMQRYIPPAPVQKQLEEQDPDPAGAIAAVDTMRQLIATRPASGQPRRRAAGMPLGIADVVEDVRKAQARQVLVLDEHGNRFAMDGAELHSGPAKDGEQMWFDEDHNACGYAPAKAAKPLAAPPQPMAQINPDGPQQRVPATRPPVNIPPAPSAAAAADQVQKSRVLKNLGSGSSAGAGVAFIAGLGMNYLRRTVRKDLVFDAGDHGEIMRAGQRARLNLSGGNRAWVEAFLKSLPKPDQDELERQLAHYTRGSLRA